MIGAFELCELAGITHRQLIYWIDRGYVAPTVGGVGPGTPLGFDWPAVAQVTRVAERVRWGMTVEAAARPVDPPLPDAPHPRSISFEARFLEAIHEVPVEDRTSIAAAAGATADATEVQAS